jgi:hypothetical protein
MLFIAGGQAFKRTLDAGAFPFVTGFHGKFKKRLQIQSFIAKGLPRLITVFKAFQGDDSFFRRLRVFPEIRLGGFGFYFGNTPRKRSVFKDASKFR